MKVDAVTIAGELPYDDFKHISNKQWDKIRKKLEAGAAGAQALKGEEFEGLHRITYGSLRVIFEIQEHDGRSVAHVLAIGPRGVIYDNAPAINHRRGR